MPKKESQGRDEMKPDFDWEKLFFKYRLQIFLVLIGIILLGFGAFLVKGGALSPSDEIEVLEDPSGGEGEVIIVEVVGAINDPGVYQFLENDRIEDVLIAAGGVTDNADKEWMEKFLNRAAKITDGQKIYIPRENEQTDVLSAKSEDGGQNGSSTFGEENSDFINVNTATAKELDTLWGIGPVYAQKIIEYRPYSTVEELLSKGVIKQNVYDRNKDKMTVY